MTVTWLSLLAETLVAHCGAQMQCDERSRVASVEEHPCVISVGLNTTGLPRQSKKGSEHGFFVDLEQLWF